MRQFLFILAMAISVRAQAPPQFITACQGNLNVNSTTCTATCSVNAGQLIVGAGSAHVTGYTFSIIDSDSDVFTPIGVDTCAGVLDGSLGAWTAVAGHNNASEVITITRGAGITSSSCAASVYANTQNVRDNHGGTARYCNNNTIGAGTTHLSTGNVVTVNAYDLPIAVFSGSDGDCDWANTLFLSQESFTKRVEGYGNIGGTFCESTGIFDVTTTQAANWAGTVVANGSSTAIQSGQGIIFSLEGTASVTPTSSPISPTHNGDCAGTGGTCTTSAIDMTGSSLIVGCLMAQNVNPTVTSSPANINTTYLPTYYNGAHNIFTRLFYIYSPTVSSSQTFTCTGSGSYCYLGADGFNGTLTTPSVFDTQNGLAAVGGKFSSVGSITVSQPGELLYSCLSTGNAPISGVGYLDSGFTLLNTVNINDAYTLAPSVGPIDPVWSDTADISSYSLAIASFKYSAPSGQRRRGIVISSQ